MKGLHIRFLPEQEQEQNISSRQFLKQAEFINVDSILPKEDGTTGNGGSQGGNEGGSQNGGENTGGGTNTGGGDNNGGGTNDDDGDGD